MKKISCPFCNSINCKFIEKIKSSYKNKEYDHYLCNNCLLEFFTPLVFEAWIYEGEEYDAYKEFHNKRKEAPYWSLSLLSLLKKNNIELSWKKILEIWAWDWINFHMFNNNFNINNKDYSVIELDKKSIDVCKSRWIENIYDEIFDNTFMNKNKEKYDIIIFTEVLEHQINPKWFMDNVFSILNDWWLIFLTVPNKNRAFYFLSVSTDIAPHHFLRFNKQFFYKNYNNNIIDFSFTNFKLKNIKTLSKWTSNKFLNKDYYWLLFYPIYLFILFISSLPNKWQWLAFILKK